MPGTEHTHLIEQTGQPSWPGGLSAPWVMPVSPSSETAPALTDHPGADLAGAGAVWST